MTKYLIGNWKMNLMPEEALALASGINEFAESSKNTILGIAPTNICIPNIKLDNVLVGAQNAHWEESGACTGEVSASMYKQLGCEFIIVGHSERRHDFGEDQELCTKRAFGVLAQGLKLVYCIGETLEENEQGQTFDILKTQLEPVLEQVQAEDLKSLIIAYEPVWAIGTGKVATIEQISEISSQINEFVKSKTNTEVPILYGGSVKPDNYAEIITIDNVNGALVGGASLKLESFKELFEISERN